MTFSASDPSGAPTSTRAVLQVEMPACQNPSDKACSKWIPSLDPLVNGPFARLKAIDMVLVDDDLPQAAARGPLRDLADRCIDGRLAYDVTVDASDPGAEVKGMALERFGEGKAKTFAAPCDPTHNTPSLGSAICPPSRSGDSSVDTSTLPEAATRRAIWPATPVPAPHGRFSSIARRRPPPRGSARTTTRMGPPP